MIRASSLDFWRLCRVICACLVVITLLCGIHPALAQETGESADLSALDVSAFPRIDTYMHAWDASGAFIGGLTPAQMTILENDQRIPVLELEELQPGAVFVVAINPGRPFALRDGQGISRFDLIREVLAAWAQEGSAAYQDDLSLMVNNGPMGMHLTNRAEFLDTLNEYVDDARSAEPGMDIFSQAINAASSPLVREGMGRSVLLITAPPRGDMSAGLQDLVSISNQAGVQVSVWLVDSEYDENSPSARAFRELANQTGGNFFLFSGNETFPSPEDYIATQRGVYHLAYNSQIISSGEHTVSVEVTTASGLVITSNVQTITLNIQPPEPAFVRPPASIVRQNPEDAVNVTTDLEPTEQDLTVAVNFPDGMPREIMTTTLYVDGALVEVKNGADSNSFSWDLSRYLESGQHLLKVETVDSLGIQGVSQDLVVDVQVNRTQPSIWKTVTRNVPWFVGLVVLLTGTVLVTVLIVSGRIRPKISGRDEKTKPNSRSKERSPSRRFDPVTQPVNVKTDAPVRQKQGLLARLSWPHRRSAVEAIAFLHRLEEGEMEAAIPPIPISKQELIIGKDGGRCDLVVDDPSVEPIHARLVREGVNLRLSDLGSVAGTWVDFSPVSSAGTVLEHGDMIHIGRVGFRVSFKNGARVRKPIITPEEPIP